MRMLALSLAVAMCASFALAQTSCNDDAQCSADYFCEAAIHSCQKCLHCEDFKRELPMLGSPSSCIKTVVDCGSCLQGLVVDHRGDVDGKCVPPVDPAAESSLPVYIWSIIGFVILGVFIAMIIIIIYILRRKDLFRISTATWLRSSCTSTNLNASAPEPPPPYNPYTPVRAESPFSMPDVAYSPPPPTEEETSHPFIKRVPTTGPQSAREVAGSQNARVYDPPAYVRIPQSQNPVNDARDSNNWPSIHNEDTTPHDWTPNSSTNDDANGNASFSEVPEVPESAGSAATSSDLPALLAAARETTLVAPPAKKLKTQDTNNNGSRGASSSDSGDFVGSSSMHATEAPSIYFNIVHINNTRL